MQRRLISDAAGRFRVEVSVSCEFLEDALERDGAEPVLKCALIAALSVLAQDGPWPHALLESMSAFMADMKGALQQELPI